jgi:hypothetical protein
MIPIKVYLSLSQLTVHRSPAANHLRRSKRSLLTQTTVSCLFFLFSIVTAKELPLEVYLQKVIQASYERVDLGLRSDEIDVQRRQLTAEYLPSLTYSLNSTQSEQGPRDVFVGSIPIRQPATSYEYHSTSLNLSQQLFDWGNSFRKKKKLSLEENALKADYLQQARVIAEQAISLYYQLSEATAVYELLKQELSDTRKQQMTWLTAVLNRLRINYGSILRLMKYYPESVPKG